MTDAAPAPEPVFDHVGYQIMNCRRLEHLASLGLDLHGFSVLELGAGIGGLTSYFINRACQVTSIEGRADSTAVLAGRFPTVTAMTMDLDAEDAPTLPRREIVFCYGLLYHLGGPEAALARMGAATKRLLLLETCVSPAADERLVDLREDADFPSASINGAACNPSRAWIVKRLKRSFAHVYLPKTQPNHPDFPIDWDNASTTPNGARAVFVAAHRPIDNPLLGDEILQRQTRCP